MLSTATSCSDPSENNLVVLDSLQTEIRQLDDFLKSIDYKQSMACLDSVNDGLHTIAAEYQDTFPKSLAVMVSSYRGIRKPLSNLKDRYHVYLQEMQTSANQIDNLRKDIQEGNLEGSLVDKYLNDEREALASWQQEIEKTVNMAKKKLIQYDSIQPYIRHTVDSLKAAHL